jgi:O-antigen/teichoic acid export membrane protein
MTGKEAEDQRVEQPAHSTRRPSFFQGVTFTGAGIAVNIIFLFLETVVAVRLLDTDSFGVFVLLTVVVNFLVMATDFGYKTAVTQLIASSDHTRQAALANSALLFRLLVVALVSALIWLGWYALRLVDPSRALVRYAAYVPIMLLAASLDELLLAILQGYQAYHHMAVAQVLRGVLRLGLSVVFLFILNLGMMALIYSWIVSFGIAAAYEYLVLPLSRRLFLNRYLMGEMLRFGFPLQLNRFLWFVSGQIDTLLLGALLGPTAVALLSVAGRIPKALLRLSHSYTAVYFPTVTELLAEGKRSQARWLLDHSLRLISFGMALVALTSVVFSRQIVTLLFSEKYAASSPVFALLMIALHMTVLVTLMGYTLTAAGYPGRSLGANAIQEILRVLADLVFIPVFGFVGPTYARLMAYYVANPLSVWLLRRSDIRVTVAPYVKQTALLWLCSAAFWWAQPEGYMVGAAIIAVFLVLNIALSTVSRDDLRLVLPEAVTKQLGKRKEAIP